MDPVRGELGPEGAMLHLLGAQLRQSLACGDLDANVIAASEWALDRHRARAVRLLAMGFSEDESLHEQLSMLWRESGSEASSPATSGQRRADEVERFVSLLQTIGSEQMREQIRALRANGTRKHLINRQSQETPEPEGALEV